MKKSPLEIFRQHGGQMRMSEAHAQGISRYMLYNHRAGNPRCLSPGGDAVSAKGVKNTARSVRQRLLNRAGSDQRPFNELLQYYAMERFLYRLSQSEHADRFILKGAFMLRAWQSPELRDIRIRAKTGRKTLMLSKPSKLRFVS